MKAFVPWKAQRFVDRDVEQMVSLQAYINLVKFIILLNQQYWWNNQKHEAILQTIRRDFEANPINVLGQVSVCL